jgi:tRNA pseudouridine32 synthase / 23S rRNA pseudouridine746 synthase
MSAEDLSAFNDYLDKESIHHHYQLKKLKKHWDEKLAVILEELTIFQSAIDKVKVQRRAISARLQDQLHSNYTFLNAHGNAKNLLDIFSIEESNFPPSGSGECAAPKLLQHAYRMGYKPIAMAEFWWGPSPNSEIRKHGHFYPACNGKCKPILGHMLIGLDVEDNPMLINPALGKELPIVFEDDHLIVINKPAEFLSVPGKTIHDSVYSRMRALYPHASGPLILHRLDMSTSGLMLIAKNKDVHFDIQQQFIRRKVKKMYTAIIEGNLETDSGYIELPLRVDLDDRPRQMVCYTYGKEAKTHWKRIKSHGQKHLIQFYPITGRTHQLRVHAAHPKGLNCPIIGDDIYGTKEERLHLHATTLTILHPITKKEMIFKSDPEFKL